MLSGNTLFIILFLHQTTTCYVSIVLAVPLFIILFLHQTTTRLPYTDLPSKLFIILFLHQTTTECFILASVQLLFIILFLHQTTTVVSRMRICSRCLSSCSYIKPQHLSSIFLDFFRCLSSCSYIKPQHPEIYNATEKVVYHLVPTSNHN